MKCKIDPDEYSSCKACPADVKECVTQNHENGTDPTLCITAQGYFRLKGQLPDSCAHCWENQPRTICNDLTGVWWTGNPEEVDKSKLSQVPMKAAGVSIVGVTDAGRHFGDQQMQYGNVYVADESKGTCMGWMQFPDGPNLTFTTSDVTLSSPAVKTIFYSNNKNWTWYKRLCEIYDTC